MECAILDQYYSHGHISVLRNLNAPGVDMLITKPNGDFISAWQFKDKQSISNIDSFYTKMLYIAKKSIVTWIHHLVL